MSKNTTQLALAESLKQQLRIRPFDDITVADICEPVGVSRRSFYRYFADKYDLLSWIYRETYESLLSFNEDRVSWDYFSVCCEHLYSDRAFYRNAIAVEGQNSLRSLWRELLTPVIAHDFKDIVPSRKTGEFWIWRITDALFDTLYDWLKKEPCTPPLEFASNLRSSLALYCKRGYEISSQENTE